MATLRTTVTDPHRGQAGTQSWFDAVAWMSCQDSRLKEKSPEVACLGTFTGIGPQI